MKYSYSYVLWYKYSSIQLRLCTTSIRKVNDMNEINFGCAWTCSM